MIGLGFLIAAGAMLLMEHPLLALCFLMLAIL